MVVPAAPALVTINKDKESFLQISLTEKRTKFEIDKLIEFLKKYEK